MPAVEVLLNTKLIRAHVENQLSALLDTNRFLRNCGLRGVVPLERDDHLTKLFLKQQAKLPGYVCSLTIRYPVDVTACDRPSILLETVSTPSMVCGTVRSLSDASQESNTMPMTPQSVIRDILEDCRSSFDSCHLHEEPR